jgi:hypothetical protein
MKKLLVEMPTIINVVALFGLIGAAAYVGTKGFKHISKRTRPPSSVLRGKNK